MTLGKDYLIKDINPVIYKQFKAACAYYGLSMKDTLIKHMENVVSDYLNSFAMSGKPKIYKNVKGKQ